MSDKKEAQQENCFAIDRWLVLSWMAMTTWTSDVETESDNFNWYCFHQWFWLEITKLRWGTRENGNIESTILEQAMNMNGREVIWMELSIWVRGKKECEWLWGSSTAKIKSSATSKILIFILNDDDMILNKVGRWNT